jgi:hypothetical protein
MYSVTTQVLSMPEAQQRFQGFIDLQKTLPENEPGTLSGTEVWLPGCSDADPHPHYVLFVRAAEFERDALVATCSQHLRQINWESENLEHKQSFVLMGAKETGIYVPLWSSGCLRISERQCTIRVVFIGSDWAVDTRHHLTGEDLDDYMIGCQVHMDSTGPHYKPWRMYSEETLNAMKGLSGNIEVPGRMVRTSVPAADLG